jgi:hypothetical protein
MKNLIYTTLAAIASLGFVFAAVPALAQAQYFNYCNLGYAAGNYNCAPGTLQVYVQVMNTTYNGNGPTTRNPQDFTVAVSGLNPSPASFPGSLQGTPVSVGGAYTVTATQMPGWAPSYSQGCQGTLGAGQQATCVITESSTLGYYSYPQPYPYQYYPYQTLSCAPSVQTVGFGQTATFTAVGGTGPYTWQTPNQTYQAIGPTLNVVLPLAGTQAVSVSSGGQTAMCTVTVTGTVYNPSIPASYVAPTAPNVTVITPTLPNTGFEPVSATGIAFAVAALIAAAVALFPYVRSTLASLFA